MTNHPSQDFLRLYQTPIDQLALSAQAVRTLKWNGLTSVVDCLMFYPYDLRISHLPENRSSCLWLLMYGEVFEALVAQGHWRLMESANVWGRLSVAVPFWVIGRKRIVTWQGQEQDLFKVPLEALGFSDTILSRLKKMTYRSVGDCTHIYEGDIWMLDAPSTPGHVEQVTVEIEQALKAHGYWPLIEEQTPRW